MFITLQRVEQLTPSIWTFWFQPDSRIRFQAGQYFEIHLPHHDMDSRGDKRWLTISSAPHQPLLGVTVRFAAERGSSFKNTLRQLSVGSTIYASDPIGDFVLPKDVRVPVVFVTAGIGSTPVHSMLQDMAYKQENRDIRIVHGVHVAEDLVFDAFFKASAVQYASLVSQPKSDWSGPTGRLTPEYILSLAGKPAHKLFYFSGPEDFIMQLVYGLHALGVERHQVVLDYFPGYNSTD